MPNLWVMRPADPIETAECWALAIAREDGPSLLALSRQNVPTLRGLPTTRRQPLRQGRLCAGRGRGPAQGDPARHRHRGLARRSRRASGWRPTASAAPSSRCRASSCSTGRTRPTAPRCWAPALRIAIEAAAPYGWARYVGERGRRGRHDGLWRLGAGTEAVRALRHHGGAGGRAGATSAQRLASQPISGRSVVSVRIAINGFGRIGRNVLRAVVEAGRSDVSVVAINDLAPAADQRASAPLRFRAWPLPGRGPARGRHARLRHRPDQGAGGAHHRGPALAGSRGRRRAGVHRRVHQARRGSPPSRGRRPQGAGLGALRRRRPHGLLQGQPRPAAPGAPGGLERVLHHQLPRSGRQGAERCDRHRGAAT